eukprot:jgi/Tetstr1/424761/TSEL_015278.t1
MATQEMNAELHELRELLDADTDADIATPKALSRELWKATPLTTAEATATVKETLVRARYDFTTATNNARGKYDDGKRRYQLYTGADVTLMEAALNVCEWKLKQNIKTAAFERLSKMLKKHMLPEDGSELTET